jgi:predicted permease
MLLERIAGIIFPIFAIVAAAGWFYGRRHKPDMAFANQLNMDVFVPALVFAALAGKSFDLASYQPRWPLGGIAVVLGSGLLAWPLARLLGRRRPSCRR